MPKKTKKKPKHVLLIWSMIPESTHFYLLPLSDLTKQERTWLKRCHGHFVNEDSTSYKDEEDAKEIDESLTMVSELLADPHAEWLKNQPDYFREQAERFGMKTLEFKSLYGAWHDYKFDLEKSRSIPRTRLIHSGFFL